VPFFFQLLVPLDAGPRDRRVARCSGAQEAGAAILDAVVLALAVVASRGDDVMSCTRTGVAPFGT